MAGKWVWHPSTFHTRIAQGASDRDVILRRQDHNVPSRKCAEIALLFGKQNLLEAIEDAALNFGIDHRCPTHREYWQSLAHYRTSSTAPWIEQRRNKSYENRANADVGAVQFRAAKRRG